MTAAGPSASIILIAGRSAPVSPDAVKAARKAVGGAAEVVLVLTGAGAGVGAGAAAAESQADRVVALGDEVPFGAAANRGAGVATGPVLCFATTGALAGAGTLAPLVDAALQPGIACAVPGAVGANGSPLDGGHRLDSQSPGWAGAVCVGRRAFVDAGGFNPAATDLRAAAIDLSAALGRRGRRTVHEPAALVVAAEPSGAGHLVRDLLHEPVGRILVVTAHVPAPTTSHGGRWVHQVVTDLAAAVPATHLTVLAFDGSDARRAAPALLRLGIEVAWGPDDWDRWLWDRPLAYSHVVLADLAAARRLGGLLAATQPQAHTVLALPSLAFRDVRAGGAAGDHPDDEPGTRVVIDHAESVLHDVAGTAASAWCAGPDERSWFAAVFPGHPCAVIPPAAAPADPVPFDQRSGYVVLATPGADITAGHEDAALAAAQEVLPLLLARDPHAHLRIVVDDPSPAVQLLTSEHVELVPAGGDPARWLRRSRVCLGWYPRGTGGREALALALDTRTPIVTHPQVLAADGVPRLSAVLGAGSVAGVALRAEQLHHDRAAWDDAVAHLTAVADGPRSPAAARLRLVRACADAGLAPTRDAPLAEPVPLVTEQASPDESVLRLRNVSVVGSAWKEAPPGEDGPVPDIPAPEREGDWTAVPVNDQYRRWRARYGPTGVRLERLGRRLRGLVRRPTISVVMPVHNTEPSWLDDAINSVRAQVYEHWELCVADDGSDRADTIEVLDRHAAEDGRIRVTRLPGNAGIAAASNAALALATGDFVAFLDHDDELKPHALGEVALLLDSEPTLDVVYTDEDKRDPDGELCDPFFKPDWSPDHLMGRNYVCHLLVLRRTLVDKLGGFRLGFDGSQDYDLVLRATELTHRIAHLAEPLYTWRKVDGSTAAVADAKPWALDAARRALTEAMARRGTPGVVEDGLLPTTYRARYALRGRPKVSIIIPTRDKVDLLRNCVDSIRSRSTYDNYELVVVDNQSVQPETLAYLASFPGRVVRYPYRFNYSRMVNLGAREAAGDMLLFLNNDTEVHTADWLEALLEHGQRPEVGIVGPRLRYPSGHPQHEGTVVGYKGGHAGNVDHRGFWGLGELVRNCSAVTGACLMIRPSVYWRLGGHEERLRIAFNDVDLCLRARQAGYEVIYTPYAELMHVEGGTRGIHAHKDDDDRFEARWVTHKCLDPYYNANFERLYPFRIRG